MRRLRTIIGLVLATVAATAVSVGISGTAHAVIVNAPGYSHLKVQESGQCLMWNPDTGAAQVWRCLNALSEEWRKLPVEIAPGGGITHFMLTNRWTGQCMTVPSWPVNGTKVVTAPCDVNDVRQYWRTRYLQPEAVGSTGPAYHIQSLQGALCLDKPDGNNSQGVQLQMWACASQDPNWNPFFDFHHEQWWYFI